MSINKLINMEVNEVWCKVSFFDIGCVSNRIY